MVNGETMNVVVERRLEKRLSYHWPVWFAEDFNGVLSQGQMIDINSQGAAFSCYADKCPFPGQEITARFSVPHYTDPDSFEMESFVRRARINRIENSSPYIRRVAIQFAKPLPFCPGETAPEKETHLELLEEMAS